MVVSRKHRWSLLFHRPAACWEGTWASHDFAGEFENFPGGEDVSREGRAACPTRWMPHRLTSHRDPCSCFASTERLFKHNLNRTRPFGQSGTTRRHHTYVIKRQISGMENKSAQSSHDCIDTIALLIITIVYVKMKSVPPFPHPSHLSAKAGLVLVDWGGRSPHAASIPPV